MLRQVVDKEGGEAGKDQKFYKVGKHRVEYTRHRSRVESEFSQRRWYQGPARSCDEHIKEHGQARYQTQGRISFPDPSYDS